MTAFDSAEAEVKRAMARNSAGIVIAVTNDKLATAAPYRVAGPRRSATLWSKRPRRLQSSQISKAWASKSTLLEGSELRPRCSMCDEHFDVFL